jgi:hypothetical protein
MAVQTCAVERRQLGCEQQCGEADEETTGAARQRGETDGTGSSCGAEQ